MDNNQNKTAHDHNPASSQQSKVLATLSGNDGFNFVLKKTERLTSAVYLITSFFDEKEPVKWKLRSLASDLLSTSLTLKNGFRSGREGAVTDMRNMIIEIGSLLTVAKNVGLVSDANYSIIDDEFSNLLEYISKEVRSDLSRGFFAESLLQVSAPKRETDSRETERFVEDMAPARKESRDLNSDKGQKIERRIPEGYLPAVRVSEAKKEKPEGGVVSLKKNSRQNIILDMVKKKKEIMIKDVAPLITGCSEKTIQRELLAMVSAGILRKEGEKRWSKYSLANE